MPDWGITKDGKSSLNVNEHNISLPTTSPDCLLIVELGTPEKSNRELARLQPRTVA
jgi:hypothetical protein